MHEALTQQDVQQLLIGWVDATEAFHRWTSIGHVTVERDGGVMRHDDHVFDLEDYLQTLVTSGAVDAICSVCGHEHTVEPDAREYPCDACGGASSVTSPLVLVGYA